MKKFLFLLMAGVVLSGGVYAKHNCGHEGYDCKIEHKLRKKNTGGFMDASTMPVSVAQIMDMPDEAFVVVTGYITESLGGDEYDFTDGTDNITVEIGKKDWKGQWVSAKDRVMLKGRVDKNASGTSIDVKSVKILR